MPYNPNLHPKGRPTIFRGIRMRSRNEARFASWLDTWCCWEYEPFAFRGDNGLEWLPDYRLWDVAVSWSPVPMTVFVELKHSNWFAQVTESEWDETLRKIGAIFDSDPSAVVILAESETAPLLVRPGGDVPVTVPATWVLAPDHRRLLAEIDTPEWANWAV